MATRKVFLTDKRGYVVEIGRDLLGDVILERRWYGLHNRRGGRLQQVFQDDAAAFKEAARVERTRMKRGYKLASISPPLN